MKNHAKSRCSAGQIMKSLDRRLGSFKKDFWAAAELPKIMKTMKIMKTQ